MSSTMSRLGYVQPLDPLVKTQLALKVDIDFMKRRFRLRVIRLKVRDTPVAL